MSPVEAKPHAGADGDAAINGALEVDRLLEARAGLDCVEFAALGEGTWAAEPQPASVMRRSAVRAAGMHLARFCVIGPGCD
jgi:hypothetical protein